MEENKNIENQSTKAKAKNTKKIAIIGIVALLVIAAIIGAVLLLGKNDDSGECEHKWGETSVITAATCTEEGVGEHKCSECGEIEPVTVPKLPHVYDREVANNDTLKSEATCTSAEIYYKSCVCGAISTNDTETFASGEKKGHEYVLQSTTEATCEMPAQNIFACACGDTYADDLGEKLGHEVDRTSAVEKNISGCEYALVGVCSRCNNEVEVGERAFHHNYSASIEKEASCKADGVKLLSCACGYTKEVAIPKNESAHVWVKGEVVDGERIDTCSSCGDSKTVTVYGETTGKTNANDFADKEIEINDANLSLDSGVIDSIGNKDITISAGKHEGEDREQLGLSADKLAQIGNSPIYDFTISDGNGGLISKFGDDNYVTITLPYKPEEGEDVDNIAIWFINDDGELEAIKATYSNGYVTFKTNHFSYYTVTRLKPAERCAVYGHSYVTHTTVGTCTTDGYDTLVCVRCHDKKIENFVEAPGHAYVLDKKDATCTENGYNYNVCSTCGHKYGTKLLATGHNYGNPTWDWSDDCSSVKLTLVCAHDAAHKVELTPDVDLTVVSLSCCDYVKREGTVSIRYNGVFYSDEKVVETGTIEHKFATEWTYDDDAHWHACVCGEKADTTAHVFENETITKAPNCKDAGEKTSYCTCGATKVVAIPASGEHNYVNGSCSVCGSEKIDCDHTELKSVTVNLSDYGCCEWILSYESCACGQVKKLSENFIQSEPPCDLDQEVEEEHENEDGSYEGKMVGVCSICSLKWTVFAKMVQNGCLMHVEYSISLTVNDATIIGNAMFEIDEEDHGDTVREEIDLSTHNSCGGKLVVYKCSDCDKIIVIDNYKDLVCTLGEPVLEEITDENGLVHKLQKTSCAVCGLEWVNDISVDEITICEKTTYIKSTVSRGGVVIAETNATTSKNTHKWESSVELLGDSCEDGVRITRYCTICDKTSSYTEYSHGPSSYDPTSINLSKHTTCGGIVKVYDCDRCGAIMSVNSIDLGCNFTNEVVKELKDDSGKLIGYEVVSTCASCGLVLIESDWIEDVSTCEYKVNKSTHIYKGDECVFEFEDTVYTEGEHDVEYTYEPRGEGCEDGYKTIATCKKCGITSTSYTSSHAEERFTLDLSEHSACGGTVTGYRCAVCGIVISSSNVNLGCAWYEIYHKLGITPTPEDSTDENGVVHKISKTTCSDCGLTYTVDEWSEKKSDCVSITHRKVTLSSAEETIFEFESSNTQTNHNYRYSNKAIIPNSTICDSGYYEISYCSTCGDTNVHGPYSSREHYYEYRHVYVDDSGICGGYDLVEQYCYTCGIVIGTEYKESGWCNWQYVGKNNDGHEVYRCNECGVEKHEYTSISKDENCVSVIVRATVYYLSDKELFRNEYTTTNVAHNYLCDYVLNGESCEDGYTVTYTCVECGDTYSEEGTEHVLRPVFVNKDCCGNVHLTLNSCGCGELANFDLADRKFTYTEDEASSTFTWNCGLILTVSSENTQDCCTIITNASFIVTLNGEELYRVNGTNQSVRHEYEESYTLIGKSCEDGYIVTSTCKKCGYSVFKTRNDHNMQAIDLTDKINCCGSQHFDIYTCACGYESRYYLGDQNCEYDKDKDLLVFKWNDCGLTLSQKQEYKQEGCKSITTTTYIVTLNGEEVYKLEKSYEYVSHTFSEIKLLVESGKTYVVAGCEGCDEEVRNEIREVEVKYEDGKNYFYYYFTPEKSGPYSYRRLGSYNYYDYIDIYAVVGDRMIRQQWNNEYRYNRTVDLKAGITYVLRFQANSYSNGEILKFIISSNKMTECSHSGGARYSELVNGATSCEDGVLNIRACEYCGEVTEYSISYTHRTEYKQIALEEFGACYGSLEYYACACGEINYENLYYNCCGKYTYNEYYDDQNRLVKVETINCSTCGLRIDRSYYKVRDVENCKLVYYYTVTIKIGDELILKTEYTSEKDEHDYQITGELLGGEGSTCKEGVALTYTCKQCDHSYTSTNYWHVTFEKERIELDSVCGGYATFNGCLCGQESSIDLTHALCEFGTVWCEPWIEDAIIGYHFNFRDDTYFSSNAYIYSCAVTDPADAACTYKIRYASYYKKAEDECRAYRYQTWQFGYDEATGTCDYEITFKTGSYTYHNYTVTEENGGKHYVCADCGTYCYENYYYDSDNNLEKYEKIVKNTLSDGNIKYYEYVEEYSRNADGDRYLSREYLKEIDESDREYWRESINYEESYTGPFGDSGRKVTSSYKTSYGDEDRSEEYAYVYYKGYSYNIYYYKTYSDYWEKWDYSYSFTDGCVRTTKYTTSDGTDTTNTENCCYYYDYNSIQSPTCTQEGLYCYTCVICGGNSETYTRTPNDHSWVEIDKDWYYCFDCGLENSNGVSGDIAMEDLTEKYGNGENYVIGYYVRSNVEFDYYVSLIFADGAEVVVEGIEFTTVDGVRAVAFSKAAVDTWATENGYSDYDVRFSFVPYGADGSFDYAITFTEEIDHSTITGRTAFTEYIGAGEVKEYVISTPEGHAWTFSAANVKEYIQAELYSESGNLIDSYSGWDFSINCDTKGGETYILKVKWYYSDAEGNVRLIFNCR